MVNFLSLAAVMFLNMFNLKCLNPSDLRHFKSSDDSDLSNLKV